VSDDRDLVPRDDRIIGTAIRWSLVALAVIAVVAVVVTIAMRREAPEEKVIEKDVRPVEVLDSGADEMPEVAFVDITAETGIDFVHVSGARGDKLLPETMGGGVAFLDHDGDGDQDLLFVNSREWPGAAGGARATSALYRNDGAGRFEDVSSAVGMDIESYGMGVAVADYDGDGDTDVYLTAVGPNRLLRNDGGKFVDVTAAVGVAGADDSWGSSAGFVDLDGDGDLDLFVCNYVRWSREIDIELDFTLNGTDRAYGPPTNYQGQHAYLFRNDGDGTFSDVSEQAGIQVVNPLNGDPMAKALGVAFVDVNVDGAVDVLVANDTVQNFLFRNRRDGTFEEVGSASGVGFDGTGNATGAMGIDVGHHRNDAELAVGIGNFANEMTSLFVSRAGTGLFTDDAVVEGIGSPSRAFLSFGLFLFDYDLDGRLDLLQANGHLEEEISEVQASQQYRQPAQLFWNAGSEARSAFAEVPRDATGDLSRPIVGRGAAYADIDGDGDLDVVLTQTGGAPLILRNDQALDRHWLRVTLRGPDANRQGIGAWIELTAGDVTQRRQVMPTRSYLSQVELPVTFGLGDATSIDRLEVVWPDGTRQSVAPPAVDQAIEIAAAS
jgi:hypothetical protein